MWFLVPRGPCVRRVILLIHYLGIDATLEKELNHVKLLALDGIVNGRLAVVVDQVGVGTIPNELFDGFKMSLSRRVEDG